MTIKEKVVTAVRWTVLARFSGQLVTWAVTIFVIRILSPEDYGLMAMAMVPTALLFLINNIGLETVLVQKKSLHEELRKKIFGFVVVTNLLCFFAMQVIADPLARFFEEPQLKTLVQVLASQFLVLIFETLPLAKLERDLDFRKRSIVDFTTMFAASILTLAIALAGFGVWALVLGHLLSQVLRVVGLNLIVREIRRPIFSFEGMKDVVKFGGFVSADRILWFVFAESDKFVGGKVFGTQLLGFYSVASHLASLPITKIAGLISSIAFPAFSEVQLHMESVRFYLRKAIRLMSVFAFPVFFGISCVASNAVVVLLGDKWIGAILPLQILAVIMPIRMISTIVPPVLWGLGDPKISAGNFAIAAAIMVPAFLVGAQGGPVGLAISWAAAYPIVFVITIYRVAKVVGSRLRDLLGEMVKPILCATGMYASVVVSEPVLVDSAGTFVTLLQQIIVGAVAYASLIYIIHRQVVSEVLDLVLKRQVQPS